MFKTFINAWKIEDLRKKMLFTLFILFIFRLGAAIPVPFLDAAELAELAQANSETVFGLFDLFSGGSFSQATLFALTVTPYINASIIINLLQVVIPALERLSKEGEEGRKKIQVITRYVSLGFSLGLGIAYYFMLKNNNVTMFSTGFDGWFTGAVIVTCFAAGAMLLMWLGEQIDSEGIGNGISLLIFTGIISRATTIFSTTKGYIEYAKQSGKPEVYLFLAIMALISLAIVVLVVVMTNAERRIPIQYAKKVVGRKMYGGQNTHIPIKVNMTGVLPIIFASALTSIPSTILTLFSVNTDKFFGKLLKAFSVQGVGYAVVYVILIIAFNYFYVAIQYNPIEMANNLRKNSGGIPGIRPGKPTSDFISKVLSKITFIGAIFLAIVAAVPILFALATGMQAFMLGGTSVLIVVGVALETSRTLESYMLMRHHKGFLE